MTQLARQLVEPDSGFVSPISPASRAVLRWHTGSAEGSAALNRALVITLQGEVNVDALKRAFHEVVSRHELLRAAVSPDGSQWIVNPETVLDFQFQKAGSSNADAVEQLLIQTTQQVLATPIDPSIDSLFRVRLFQIDQSNYALLLVSHLPIADIDAIGIVAADAASHYTAIVSAHSFDSPVHACNIPFDQSDSDRCVSWWTKQPGSGLRSTRLTSKPATDSLKSARVDLNIRASLRDDLLVLAREQSCSLYDVLVCALSVLIARITGDATPAIHCSRPTTADPFTNEITSMAISFPVDMNATGAQLLHMVHDAIVDARSHPIRDPDNLAHENSSTKLCDQTGIRFSLIESLNSSVQRFGSLDVAAMSLSLPFNVCELDLAIVDYGTDLAIECQYHTAIFDEKTIGSWLGAFRAVLNGLVTEKHLPVGVLEILDPNHYELINGFSAPQATDGVSDFSSVMISPAANRLSDEVALIIGSARVSYRELERITNQLASVLAVRGTSAGRCIAILLADDMHRFVAQSACLKLAVPFVALSAAWSPQEQLAAAKRANADFLVTTSKVPRPPDWETTRILLLDKQAGEISAQSEKFSESADAPLDKTALYELRQLEDSSKLCVTVPRSAVLSVLKYAPQSMAITATDRIVCITDSSGAADLTVAMAVVNAGAVVILVDSVAASGASLVALISKHSATGMIAPASVWKQVCGHDLPAAFRQFIVNGSDLDEQTANRLLAKSKLPIRRIFGTAETGYCSIVGTIDDARNCAIAGKPAS